MSNEMKENGERLGKDFGLLLTRLRNNASLSLCGFAKLAKASPAWLSYIEHGERRPSWEMVLNSIRILSKNGASKSSLEKLRSTGQRLILAKAFTAKRKTGVRSSFILDSRLRGNDK
ncbi:MAG: helix-turn-helix domain-containing protein [Elusimicrobia bacterium]|nr:helix-turn-helix domain-containing protein [Elusimicrobiota bacterium]